MNDSEFARAFESCELSNESFHHRDHIRLAWIYLQRYGEQKAGTRIAASIRKFAAHFGKTDKYHETMTIAWLRLVAYESKGRASFEELLEASPMLLEKQTLAAFYSDGLLQSDRAKNEFVAPDLKPLPE
jgi:hypothetical protein